MELLYVLIPFMMISPIILTIFNIKNLVSNNKVRPNIIDGSIIILGLIFTVILFYFWDAEDYNIALLIPSMGLEWHTPIASWHLPTIVVFAIFGFIGYGVLRIYKLILPPLVIVICISCMFISGIIGVVWILQLSPHLFEDGAFIPGEVFYFCLFPFNYIICYFAIIKSVAKEYIETQSEKHYKNPILNQCNLLLSNSKNWSVIALISMIPILSITILILTLFGQQPNAAIKAFTETSDWLLSQEISPPPIEVDAHYLCTVSLRGHRGYVKPLRYGIRRNHRIIVNRQLCVANAFEELIHKRTPKLHKFVRQIYDIYGYPLSKNINDPVSADIVYSLMKPLEWFFVVMLYLFDLQPENRIARQYLPFII